MNTINRQGIEHPFLPIADNESRALILGSFPSVQSRANAFYYGHPQNRFWKLLGILFSEPAPETVKEKTALLQRHHIALWDVVASCAIEGSADSTLTPYALNDIASLIRGTEIKHIFLNGQKAGKLYRTRLEPETGIAAVILPSTSPANAAWPLDRLAEAWQPLVGAVFERQVEHDEHL